jgi:hypothetical protein
LKHSAYPHRHGSSSLSGATSGDDRDSKLLAYSAVVADLAGKVKDVAVIAVYVVLGSTFVSEHLCTFEFAGVIRGLVLHKIHVVGAWPRELEVGHWRDRESLVLRLVRKAFHEIELLRRPHLRRRKAYEEQRPCRQDHTPPGHGTLYDLWAIGPFECSKLKKL